MMKRIRIVSCILCLCLFVNIMTGCSLFDDQVNELKGSITGNTYNAYFYTNTGEKFMTMSGEKINMKSNTVDEPTYSDGSWGYTETLSSVISITIDGKEMESCGSTILFVEDGLKPDVDFKSPEIINSKNNGSISENTSIANVVNKYKNVFGKRRVVVIQSQLGDPICAFSGKKVYWKVAKNLPKTTKLMIDGHALYIHRANFQIIDKTLLGE